MKNKQPSRSKHRLDQMIGQLSGGLPATFVTALRKECTRPQQIWKRVFYFLLDQGKSLKEAQNFFKEQGIEGYEMLLEPRSEEDIRRFYDGTEVTIWGAVKIETLQREPNPRQRESRYALPIWAKGRIDYSETDDVPFQEELISSPHRLAHLPVRFTTGEYVWLKADGVRVIS